MHTPRRLAPLLFTVGLFAASCSKLFTCAGHCDTSRDCAATEVCADARCVPLCAPGETCEAASFAPATIEAQLGKSSLAVWNEPILPAGSEPATDVFTTATEAEDPKALARVVATATQERATYERVVALLRRGLAVEACAAPHEHELLVVARRAKEALGAAIVDASAQRASPQIVSLVLDVAARLMRCDGPSSTYTVGTLVFRNAQATAWWLGEHGALSEAQLRDLAQTMERDAPSEALLFEALARATEAVIRDELPTYQRLDPKVFDAGEIERRLREETTAVVALAREHAPGWETTWDTRREAILDEADRRFQRLRAEAQTDEDSPTLEKAMTAFGGPPPPNLMGRAYLRLKLPDAAFVADALASVRAAALTTRVLGAGAQLVGALQRGDSVATGTHDGVETTTTSVRATTASGESLEFQPQLGGRVETDAARPE